MRFPDRRSARIRPLRKPERRKGSCGTPSRFVQDRQGVMVPDYQVPGTLERWFAKHSAASVPQGIVSVKGTG